MHIDVYKCSSSSKRWCILLVFLQSVGLWKEEDSSASCERNEDIIRDGSSGSWDGPLCKQCKYRDAKDIEEYVSCPLANVEAIKCDDFWDYVP